MFDDPQKELKRLEEQLLKNSMDDEEFERFYQDIYEEFGPETEPVQRAKKPAAAGRAVPKAKTSAYADIPRAVAPKKEKGVRGLMITICLECVGIAAVVLWWILRLL